MKCVECGRFMEIRDTTFKPDGHIRLPGGNMKKYAPTCRWCITGESEESREPGSDDDINEEEALF